VNTAGEYADAPILFVSRSPLKDAGEYRDMGEICRFSSTSLKLYVDAIVTEVFHYEDKINTDPAIKA